MGVLSRSTWLIGLLAALALLVGACTSPPQETQAATTLPDLDTGVATTSTAPSAVATTSVPPTTLAEKEALLLELVDESVGVRVRYPVGWHPAHDRLSVPERKGALRELLVLGTGDLGARDETCLSAPAAALASMRASDVLLWLVEWEPIFSEIGERPETLPTFFSDGSLSDCARATAPMARDWEFLRWTEQGRGFWLIVAYGAETTRAAREEVAGIVQSLEFLPPLATPGSAVFEWPQGWSEVPDHVVGGRVFPTIVWTGTEYIVWGGEKPSETNWLRSGAAFNPAMRRWRSLAPSPLTPRSEHVAVWTGSEMIVCCGRQEGIGAAAGAYDPNLDVWREIEPPPIGPAFAEAVWTGGEMVVFGGVGRTGVGNLQGAAAYDPNTDTWRHLADLPYGLERTADAAYADGVVYAWGAPFPRLGGLPDPLAYDIASDAWTPLPPLEDAHSPISPSLVWTGDELIAWGLAPEDGLEDQGLGVMFRPEAEEWQVIPPAPLDPTSPSEGTEASQAAVWIGSEVVIWTGWIGTEWDAPNTRVVAYDPGSDTWRELEPAPVPGQGIWHDPLIWTGTQLIVYGDPILVYTP